MTNSKDWVSILQHTHTHMYLYMHTCMERDVMTASSFGCQQAGSSLCGRGHFDSEVMCF